MQLATFRNKLEKDMQVAYRIKATDNPPREYFQGYCQGTIDAYKYALEELAKLKEGTQQ